MRNYLIISLLLFLSVGFSQQGHVSSDSFSVFMIILIILIPILFYSTRKSEKKWREKRRKQDEFSKKYDSRFSISIMDSKKKTELIKSYDRIDKNYKYKCEYLDKISISNPEKIKTLELEIEHYGNTISDDDYEYTSRIEEINRLRKEIKTVEIEIKNIKDELSSIEKKILSDKGRFEYVDGEFIDRDEK